MQLSQSNIGWIVDEYTTLVSESVKTSGDLGTLNWDDLQSRLRNSGEWTTEAAEDLIRIAREYGSFMLRNALALSIALEIEDGELGF